MKELEVAKEAAREAGKVVLERFGKARAWTKDQKQIVTEADIEAEKIIIGALKKNFPEHGIISEEAGGKIEGKTEFWMVDPLDGTHNFAFGIPIFAVSVGLVDRKGIKCSVVFDPNRNETWWAERGKGAYCNGKRLEVSGRGKIDDAILSVSANRTFRKGLDWKIVDKFSEIRAFGCLTMTLASIASGRIDACITPGTGGMLMEYPTFLLITEAGGKVTGWDGGKFYGKGSRVAASNGRIHKELIGLLSKKI